MELKEVIEEIDSLKTEIDKLRPIDGETEKRIEQKFRLDWNYHSNNLEGNSLTFGETKSFLLHGITAEGKPLKDHLDIKGHNEAILLLEDIIKSNRPLTETFIRELHLLILHEPYDKPAITADGKPSTKHIKIGSYKTSPNHVKTVTGEIFYFATPEETPAKMHDLMDWYAGAVGENTLHPLLIAGEFHYRFIRIHPFDDGNGRIARILMNLILMKYGYPPVIIKTQEKEDYFRALRIADGGDVSVFVGYVGEQLIRSLHLYLKGAKGENVEDEDDIDKEIALLKAKLGGDNDRTEESPKQRKLIFDEYLQPFLSITFSKINQLEDFFNSFQVLLTVMDTIGHHETYNNIVNLERALFFLKHRAYGDGMRGFVFDFTLSDFKKATEPFDIERSLRVTLHRSHCTIGFNGFNNQQFEVRYSNESAKTEFSKIANALAKDILNEINYYMKN